MNMNHNGPDEDDLPSSGRGDDFHEFPEQDPRKIGTHPASRTHRVYRDNDDIDPEEFAVIYGPNPFAKDGMDPGLRTQAPQPGRVENAEWFVEALHSLGLDGIEIILRIAKDLEFGAASLALLRVPKADPF